MSKLSNRGLIGLDECAAMPIEEVWRLHRDYISPRQVNIFSSFGYGHDVFVQAEGVWMQTADGRRILDFTGGFGVLSHGHNHPRILAARKAYAEAQRM